ncbi:MAG: zinc ribbon domain-containing protein [candidate division Zixibacteria bacterium]|nr:zinc ribbon domain-containing protein [candidate division Zixibacteria bacterium]
MCKILFIATFWLMAGSCSAITGGYMSEKLGFFVLVPSGWTVDTSRVDEVVVSDSADSSAFISIKRYQIESANEIESEDNLLTAISGLYMKLGVPNSSKEQVKFSVTSDRAIFENNYAAYDLTSKILYHKYLKGIIGRKADNGQFLYLMIAAAPQDIYDQVIPNFQLVTGSFIIAEKMAPDLFPKTNTLKYFLIFIILVLTVFFFTRNRRVQMSRNPLGKDSGNFWRCASCGRVNHIDSKFCHRCGSERKPLNSPK